MTRSVSRAAAAVLADLDLEATAARSQLVSKLLTEPTALLSLLGRLAELRAPDESVVPPIDEIVGAELEARYGDRVAPALLAKRSKIGPQNRLLLAVLLARVGEPVSLVEVSSTNDLSTGTPRRLRELRWEHGGYDIEVVGAGRTTSYVLKSPDPRPEVSAEYWLRRNIRDSKLSTPDRLVALLSARLGQPVPIEDFAYVNPRLAARGKGRAREAQYATGRRVRALREKRWQVYSGIDNVVEGLASSEYVMLTTERLPEYERIPTRTWTAVLKRADGRCENCRWGPDDGPSQGRKLIEVHHTEPQRFRPRDVNDPKKLQALCNRCHDALS